MLLVSSAPHFAPPSDVEQSLGAASAQMGRWRSLRADDEMRATLENDVQTTLKTVGWDLSDLADALSEVEAHRASFAIDDAEFARRRRLLAELRARQQDIAVELSRTNAPPPRAPREAVPQRPKPRVSEREVWAR